MGGKSSGGGGHTPYEARDTLKSAQRLRAIGLISLGPIKGPVNKWKSTYFDNTPIQNENGVNDNDKDSFNYKNTEIQFTLGTQDQAPLKGFEMSEREVTVNTEVKNTTPITRTVTDPDVTRIRLTLGVNALYSQNDQGDTNGTSVSFSVLINGRFRSSFEINGKSSSRFYKCYIIDNLPERPFNITVERNTPDSKSQRLQNATNWVSYTEIIDTKLSYPNMALVGIKTDSRYNPNFPNVNFLLYGRIIKVPSSYDPEKRTYAAGLWKGDWKKAWTNNPAWVFYDLVTDPLAGLGKRIGDYGLDKFQLYQIAKYCDELVDDGFGGKEPRMTANMWITEQRNAYDVVSDMASVFRAIAVWTGTQFTAIQDRTSDPICLYTQSNVIDGKFNRQYAALKSIYTAAEVEFADERNMYQSAVEYVADDLMIARYGYNSKKMTAFATTTRGQAHRWGKWVLATSLLEQCTITFAVGRQGLMHLPGDIIEIADSEYAGKTLGGRVVAVSGKTVTLDQAVEVSGDSYLSYLNDEMKVVKIKISSVDSKNKAMVTLASTPTGLNATDDWILKTPAVTTQLYRAIGVTENDDGSYTITALQHEPQKEAIVDGSASFIPANSTAYSGGAPVIAGANVDLSDDGVKITWSVPSARGIIKYDIKLYRNGKLYSTHLDLDDPEFTFENLPDGSYTVQIFAKNENGQKSDPVTRTFEINLNISSFTTKSLLFAIQLDWTLPQTASVGNYTEIWRATENDVSQAIKIATLHYPQNSYTINGVSLTESYYFFARCGDKSGNKGLFTEGVFGEADHNPDTLLNALEGKITKTQLGQDLIASLKNDIDTAVDEEAKVRQAAVANALSQITAQAQTTGTAINELKTVDAQQAQQIATITAKAESALSGITAEQKARADGDKANADKITAITARVGTAESTIANLQSTKAGKDEVSSIAQQAVTAAMGDTKAQITAVSNAVTNVNNKLSATHTIKTQAISGGRTAIAGIAMGASSDGVTTESSVIVMADKFGIVANANDTNVKQVFSVADGQVGIRGDLVVAGTVTQDKLSSGSGENLLYNPIFANLDSRKVPEGWTLWNSSSATNPHAGSHDSVSTWSMTSYLPNENMLALVCDGDISARFTCSSSKAPVNPNSWYMASCYLGVHRGLGALTIRFFLDDGSYIDYSSPDVTTAYSMRGGLAKGAYRARVKAKAPDNALSASVILWLKGEGDQANKILFAGRPMLEECTEHTTEPSPWANAGVTAVHGGSIIANTIRGDHIQANQTLKSPYIEGGSLNINNLFKVSSSGQVSIRAATGNVGLVINNEAIMVYDANGKLRVKMGKLS
ncbi:hypothetical protein CBG46_09865 [Actinobacillus succinogenes]|uniref:Fibronectin type III domain protein n=1 Tax=Actinobacillus succinogenes (strain ATCC 55618 / DSM 22257 / CCUG 43843 / 130Z) TaxID=339671 RepID=A6VNR7_ACTSZ|nr:phage tail protein [Actinobacillus succinogenes]ABR74614.1 Protein of unknown function DUF1983 [Actinobacillus succinogenes 130Z]PHI40961.1 hypothetical protein CBG46_09865 [Actinobacillus succinogenes]